MRNRILVLFIVLGASCANQAKEPSTPAESAVESQEEDRLMTGATSQTQIPKAQSAFAFDLQKNLPPGNVVVAPASVFRAVSVLTAALDKESSTEVYETLRLPNHEGELSNHVDNWSKTISVQRDTGFAYTDHATMFAVGKHEWSTDFLRTIDRAYRIKPQQVDSSYDLTTWSRSVTGDVLPGKPHTFTSNQIAIATAALVSDGWKYPFEKDQNKKLKFQASAGEKELTFMNGVHRGRVLREKTHHLIELPLSGSRASVWLLYSKTDLSALEPRLDRDYVEWMVRNASVEQYGISVPQFSMESTLALRPALETMGISRAFDPEQDAWKSSVVSPSNAHFGSVMANAALRFDVDGIFGRAEQRDSVSGQPTEQWTFDRPFMVLVRDNTSGTILLTARVTNPAK